MTKETMTPREIERNLSMHTGTQNYYKGSMGRIIYTDGVKYMADTCEAYWLIDIIESYQHDKYKLPFQVWTLSRKGHRDIKAEVSMQAGADQPVEVLQEILYTDFPLIKIELWLIDSTLILPSEY